MLKYFYSITVLMVLIMFPDSFLYKELYETLKTQTFNIDLCLSSIAFWSVLHSFQQLCSQLRGWSFLFHFNSAVKVLIVLMRKAVALMLSARTILYVCCKQA